MFKYYLDIVIWLMVGLRNETTAQWLARVVYAKTEREIESEEEVKALIEAEATRQGFEGTVGSAETFLFGVKAIETGKVSGEWVVRPLEKNELCVGPDIARLSKTYRILPDVAYSIIEIGIMHEDMHFEDQSAAKISQKQVESGIREYGKEKFELLSKEKQDQFIQNVLGSYASRAEVDRPANETLYGKLLESSMGKQQATEKLAALVWYVSASTVADTMPIKERESKLKETVKGYLNDCLPFLEQKEEAVNKAMDIDRAYQKGLRKLDYVSNPKYRKSFVAAHK